MSMIHIAFGLLNLYWTNLVDLQNFLLIEKFPLFHNWPRRATKSCKRRGEARCPSILRLKPGYEPAWWGPPHAQPLHAIGLSHRASLVHPIGLARWIFITVVSIRSHVGTRPHLLLPHGTTIEVLVGWALSERAMIPLIDLSTLCREASCLSAHHQLVEMSHCFCIFVCHSFVHL